MNNFNGCSAGTDAEGSRQGGGWSSRKGSTTGKGGWKNRNRGKRDQEGS